MCHKWDAVAFNVVLGSFSSGGTCHESHVDSRLIAVRVLDQASLLSVARAPI
jgi:hypothetical protein